MMAAQDGNLNLRDSSVDVTDDREARPKFWIAVYTRPRSEKKAAAKIAKFGIETFVPVQILDKQWTDRKKKVDVVIIPMIIFAKIDKDEILTINRNSLVIRILSYPGSEKPAIIPDEQIDSLRLLLTKADTPVKYLGSTVNLKDTVRIKNGNLEGLIGRVERINENKARFVVSINLLGGAMVEISSDNIEIKL